MGIFRSVNLSISCNWNTMYDQRYEHIFITDVFFFLNPSFRAQILGDLFIIVCYVTITVDPFKLRSSSSRMSFFNTLHQYVSNSVANLNISSRRFSASSRGESAAADGTVSMPTTPLLSTSRENKCSEVNEASVPPTGAATRRRERPLRPTGTAHQLLQERSKSLKSGNSSHPNSPHLGSKKSIRTSSLKEVSSLSIATTSNSTGSGSGHHLTSSSSCGSPSKKKEPKLMPSFAVEGAIRRTSWPQFAITGSG